MAIKPKNKTNRGLLSTHSPYGITSLATKSFKTGKWLRRN